MLYPVQEHKIGKAFSEQYNTGSAVTRRVSALPIFHLFA